MSQSRQLHYENLQKSTERGGTEDVTNWRVGNGLANQLVRTTPFRNALARNYFARRGDEELNHHRKRPIAPPLSQGSPSQRSSRDLLHEAQCIVRQDEHPYRRLLPAPEDVRGSDVPNALVVAIPRQNTLQ